MADLSNMKGRAGYPDWDEDMPEGCDQIAEISHSEGGRRDSRLNWLRGLMAFSPAQEMNIAAKPRGSAYSSLWVWIVDE